MVGQSNGQVPILGAKPAKAAVGLSALPRRIDAAGFIALRDGNVARDSFVDAQELVEMIRAAVREEVRTALKEAQP